MAVPTSTLRDRKAATRACYTASSSRRRAEPDATRARLRSDRMNPKYSAGSRMKSRVMKRSTLVDGPKTSVTLEDEFWTALKEIAATQNVGTPASAPTQRNTERALPPRAAMNSRRRMAIPPECEPRLAHSQRSHRRQPQSLQNRLNRSGATIDRRVPAGIVETRQNQPLHAERVHVAKRLDFNRSTALMAIERNALLALVLRRTLSLDTSSLI